MENIMTTMPFLIYFCAFLAPFLQEDVSILGAASAVSAGVGHPLFMALAVILGLSSSACLKYWLGRAAITQNWAKKYAETPKILAAGNNVQKNLGKSMFIARFIAATRLPLYIASGFFKVSFPKFACLVILTACIYVGIAFTLFHFFGEIAGEKMKIYLPIIALSSIVIYFILRMLKRKP